MEHLLKSKRMKVYRGIRNPRFRPIYKQLDDEGKLLHYYIKQHGMKYRVNTLNEARAMALIL